MQNLFYGINIRTIFLSLDIFEKIERYRSTFIFIVGDPIWDKYYEWFLLNYKAYKEGHSGTKNVIHNFNYLTNSDYMDDLKKFKSFCENLLKIKCPIQRFWFPSNADY